MSMHRLLMWQPRVLIWQPHTLMWQPRILCAPERLLDVPVCRDVMAAVSVTLSIPRLCPVSPFGCMLLFG